MHMKRREFMAGACFTLGSAFGSRAWSSQAEAGMNSMKSPFRLSVITDELTQDFDRACSIAAKDFGFKWVEVRELWNKNSMALNANEIAEARRILDRHDLRVTDVASPLFKVNWKGAPLSKYSPKGDQFNASYTFDQQGEVLERSIALAKSFGTERIRCFDFWRLDDQAPYRQAMNAKLSEAADAVGRQGLLLVLENEPSCNTATGAEAAKVLAAVTSRHFMLNWDPGNAAAAGEIPYPNGYALLPKHRIGHCHCKNAIRKPDGSYDWAPVQKGIVDWVGQFAALKKDGYHYAVSLETHWRGAGTPEASSRISLKGMEDCLRKAGALS
jgi:L-ribulose-5-phosphate 3-epimerase